MNDWIKITLITLVIISLVGLLLIPIIKYQNEKFDACEDLGGEMGDNGLCYKENSEGIMEGYKVKDLGGYKLTKLVP